MLKHKRKQIRNSYIPNDADIYNFIYKNKTLETIFKK